MYIDSFVVPVRRDRIDEYRAHAEETLVLWREHGALSATEAVADDVPDGTLTSFPMAVDLQAGEVVVVSFITFRDRAHRDAVNTAVMTDPRMQKHMAPGASAAWPFDGKRMIWGGFRTIVHFDLAEDGQD